MIKIKTNDLELLKEALESLAYQIVYLENPRQYACSDEQIATILRCEGLEIEIK